MKEQAINVLDSLLNEQEATILLSIIATKESRDSEQKSTSGDKHETARAITQHELDKLEAQLNKIQQMKAELLKAKQAAPTSKISFGTYVISSSHHYFISVGLGNVKQEELNFYAISLASPIGKSLLGKSVGEAMSFKGQELIIKAIA